MLKLCKIHACPNGTLGLHLSRAPWDPYPWVSGVQQDSNAYHGGVRSGDTVLELNGSDVLGQKISELASKIQQHWERGGTYVTVLIWRNKTENSAINQQSLQKFAKCLQNIAQLLECPVCLEVVKPPGWQCCNGHVLCNSCRGRTVKCPICRVTLGPRGRCLLADKLFTLLAESFPCDGVRGGKPSADCPNDYNDCQETPSLISARIDSPPVSASSSPSLDKFHQRKHIGNTISEHLKKQEDVSDQLAANGNPSDDNIVVLKLNSNSEKKYDSAEYNPCHHHHHHRRAYHSHSRSHSPPHTQKHHNRRRSPTVVAQQPRRTFHCPTGKSLCSILLHNATANGASNNSRSDPDAKTLASTWTQDVSRKPMTTMAKGEEKIETFGRFITEWEVLSHLTQVHQISVVQHYTTFGQAVRLQVMPAKAISCITIQSRRTWNQNKENLKNNASESVEKVQGHTLERNKNCKTSSTPKNVHRPGTELFFVACIPLQQTGDEPQEADELRNEMNDMNADTQDDTPPPSGQPEFDDCCSVDADNAGSGAGASPVVAASPRRPCTGAIKTATKSKSTDERTFGRGTGHLIQDPSPESRVNVECSPPGGFRMNSPEDTAACSWCASSPSSSSSSSSCSSSISSSTLFTGTAPPSPSTSSLASFSLSDSSYRCCSNTMTQQHAIFIWYLGSECDVENFQTVIECKRSGLKWTGCVYPLTESWSSIRRGQQQPHALSHPQPSQQEWPKQRFLVLNSMPDGGDNFFDIVIKIK